MTVILVLALMAAGIPLGLLIGWVLCSALTQPPPCRNCQEWQEALEEQAVELAKADQTIAILNHNVGWIWERRFLDGQTFQADRQAEGL